MASATDNLRHTDAERATLGAVLLNSVALETVSKHVEPSDYYEPKHSIIFSAIRDLQQEGTRADLLTLTDKLSEDGNLERAGGAAYISGLTDSVPTDANVEYYARIVADRAHRRRYSETINGIQKDLKNPSANLEEIRHRMAEAAAADSGTPADSLDTQIKNLLATHDENPPGVLLGYSLRRFWELANRLDGIQPKKLYILGAEANVAKTTLCRLVALDALESNDELNVVFFTLDDPTSTIIEGLISAIAWSEFPREAGENNSAHARARVAAIQQNRLKRQLPPEDTRTIVAKKAAGQKLTDWAVSGRLSIYDVSTVGNSAQLENIVRGKVRRGPTLVIIDALYNLDTGADGLSIREANIQRANIIKSIATRYEVPLLTTAEVRKQGGANAKPRDAKNPPRIDDLMESTKYSYNADVILMVYPHDMSEFFNNGRPEIVVDIAKNKTSDFRGRLAADFQKSAGVMFPLRPYGGNKPNNGENYEHDRTYAQIS